MAAYKKVIVVINYWARVEFQVITQSFHWLDAICPRHELIKRQTLPGLQICSEIFGTTSFPGSSLLLPRGGKRTLETKLFPAKLTLSHSVIQSIFAGVSILQHNRGNEGYSGASRTDRQWAGKNETAARWTTINATGRHCSWCCWIQYIAKGDMLWKIYDFKVEKIGETQTRSTTGEPCMLVQSLSFEWSHLRI